MNAGYQRMRPERIARIVTSASSKAAKEKMIAVNMGSIRVRSWGLTPKLSRAERGLSEADHSAAEASHEEVTKRRRLERLVRR